MRAQNEHQIWLSKSQVLGRINVALDGQLWSISAESCLEAAATQDAIWLLVLSQKHPKPFGSKFVWSIGKIILR